MIRHFFSGLLFLLFTTICQSQTIFGDGSEIYGNLLNDLKKSLSEKGRVKRVTLDGEERVMFVSWVRDHVHTMKAYNSINLPLEFRFLIKPGELPLPSTGKMFLQ